MNKLVRVTAVVAICLVGACSVRPSTSSPSASGDVAIIVLDQFSEPPTSTPTQSSDDNCPAVGMQANEVGSTGGGTLTDGSSHGQAVFDTVAQELTRAGRTLSPMSPTPSVAGSYVGPTEGWTYQGHKVVLVGVDTAGYDTAAVGNRAQAVIDTLYNTMGITRFVLNMSFVILPCDLRSWYKPHANSSLDVTKILTSYEADLAGVPDVTGLKNKLDELTQSPVTIGTLLNDPTLTQVLDLVLANLYYGQFVNVKAAGVDQSDPYLILARDPLRTWLSAITQNPMYRVIPVAAAGNGVKLPDGTKRQLPFPTAPAIWNSVVSTSSAVDAATPSLANYSNNGEVMMSADNPHSGIGTSFAAPHLSALEALYLLNGGTVSCDSQVPPLGYADSDHGVDTWDNLWLGFAAPTGGTVPTTGAALAKCGAFNGLAK